MGKRSLERRSEITHPVTSSSAPVPPARRQKVRSNGQKEDFAFSCQSHDRPWPAGVEILNSGAKSY
jgi:hypothetical protein